MKTCKYADGVPVQFEGGRLETIKESTLESYIKSRGVFRRHETTRDLLKEETAHMHSKLLRSFKRYPPCDVTGESTEVRAMVRKDTKMVTACFLCPLCSGEQR